MADNLSPEARSSLMGRINGKNTRPELTLRKKLHALGLRFRLHDRQLPGKPDIVLPRYKSCVFVHGCFWHQHQGCARAAMPKSHTEFWQRKLRLNVARDSLAHHALLALGWRVFIVWECELSSDTKSSATSQLLSARIRAQN